MSAPTIFRRYQPLSDALAAVFKANGIVCFTPFGEQPEGDDEATGEDVDKKPRPRVEICVHPAGALGRLVPRSGVRAIAGNLRESAWRSSVTLSIITNPSILEHTDFVETVEYLCDTIVPAINETRLLQYYAAQRFQLNGGTAGYKPQDGVMQTDLEAELDFTAQIYTSATLDS